MIIDLPTRRVYKADATSEYSIWYSYHSWLFCRLSQQDIHGLRGNGSSGKERTNKIQSEHSRLPCDRPNLIYFQKIIVFFFPQASQRSGIQNPRIWLVDSTSSSGPRFPIRKERKDFPSPLQQTNSHNFKIFDWIYSKWPSSPSKTQQKSILVDYNRRRK